MYQKSMFKQNKDHILSVVKDQFINQKKCLSIIALIRAWQSWLNILDLAETATTLFCFLLTFWSTAGPKEFSSKAESKCPPSQTPVIHIVTCSPSSRQACEGAGHEREKCSIRHDLKTLIVYMEIK